IKARSLRAHPAFLDDLVAGIADLRLPVFVELMDKRFYVATNIVTFTTQAPWFDFRSGGGNLVVNALAEIVTANMPMLAAYSAFASAPGRETLRHFRETFQTESATALLEARGERRELLLLHQAAFDDCWDLYRASSQADAHMGFLPKPDSGVRAQHIAL